MTAVRPLPLALVIRRVGREAEHVDLRRARCARSSPALYTMFGATMRADHMAPLWALLDQLPDRATSPRRRCDERRLEGAAPSRRVARARHPRRRRPCPNDHHRLLPPRLRRADRRSRHADHEVLARRRRPARQPARAARGSRRRSSEADLLRVHTPRVRRRRAHRRAARAGGVAEVPLVAAALPVGAADRRRLPGGGAARAAPTASPPRW